MYKAEIKFEVNGKHYEFSVVHNLNDVLGLSISDALEGWLARTKNYSANSFCKYVMSKDESFVAITEREFNILNET